MASLEDPERLAPRERLASVDREKPEGVADFREIGDFGIKQLNTSSIYSNIVNRVSAIQSDVLDLQLRIKTRELVENVKGVERRLDKI